MSDTLTDIKSRIREKENELRRKEKELAQAEGQLGAAMDELRANYKVTTIAEAEKLLRKLDEAIGVYQDKCDSLQAEMKKVLNEHDTANEA